MISFAYSTYAVVPCTVSKDWCILIAVDRGPEWQRTGVRITNCRSRPQKAPFLPWFFIRLPVLK